ELRAVGRAERFRARHEPRPREDLEGTGEVEDLDAVEDQNAGVPLLHLTLLEERITLQHRRISHRQAGAHSQKRKAADPRSAAFSRAGSCVSTDSLAR